MNETYESSTVQRLAYAARQIAIAGAEAAMSAVITELLSPVEDEDSRASRVLSQDPHHAGAPARAIDALAQTAARLGAERKVVELAESLGSDVNSVAYIGEEAGTQTQLIVPGTLIVRFDPLDGTTNAVNILNAFASVATVDLVSDPNRQARHLSGAIVGGEVDVSWSHWSRRSKNHGTYLRPLGQVSVRSSRLGTGWRRLEASQDERDPSSIASVAASGRRFREFAPYRDAAFADNGTAYFIAGNPLCAALLLGRLGAIVETQSVTLHDSAYLIPHWLLGGRVVTLDNENFDYIQAFEQNSKNFDPKSKPILPFVAFVGSTNPMADATSGPSEVTVTPRRLFRVDE